jgi:hypothetical protein
LAGGRTKSGVALRLPPQSKVCGLDYFQTCGRIVNLISEPGSLTLSLN